MKIMINDDDDGKYNIDTSGKRDSNDGVTCDLDGQNLIKNSLLLIINKLKTVNGAVTQILVSLPFYLSLYDHIIYKY